MNNLLALLDKAYEEKETHKTVVRLSTSQWGDVNGLHFKRSLRYLKRKSTGCNVMQEDVSDIGAEEVFPRITNFNECLDGIYKVITCNEKRDWESGMIDDYEYKLIPVEDSRYETQ